MSPQNANLHDNKDVMVLGVVMVVVVMMMMMMVVVVMMMMMIRITTMKLMSNRLSVE